MGSHCSSLKQNQKSVKNIKKSTQAIRLSLQSIIRKTLNNPLDKYIVIKSIGETSSGKDYLIEHKELKFKRIIKQIKNPSSSMDLMEDEVNLTKTVDHPNLIKIYEYYIRSDHFYVVTEYFENGNLQNFMKSNVFDEIHICSIIYQILSTLSHCHSNNMIHRDLKPSSIYLDKDKNLDNHFIIKIADFGSQKFVEKIKKIKDANSNEYMSFEYINNSNISEKNDIWSCGLILFQLLNGGELPFTGIINEGKYKILMDHLNNIPKRKASEEAKTLVKKLLHKNPKKRISASEALKLQWFSKIKDLKNKRIDLLDSIKEKLELYKQKNFFQNFSLFYLIYQLPVVPEIIKFIDCFRSIDSNDDGKITLDDLKILYNIKKNNSQIFILDVDKTNEEPVHKSMKEEDIQYIFQNIDLDQDGIISLNEFLVAVVDHRIYMNDDYLRFVFNYLDSNQSGLIGMKQILSWSNFQYKEYEIYQLNQIFQSFSNYKISFEDFKSIVKHKYE